ncbi:helix-turn-helix domain-containing protein [Isoptericola variabilis]|uniref:Helix-turn-helix domain protein n=1 Tax=Isoptericola variabilis (strain 225) TaxID=743718 RepID=F6FRT0_ISOV2|nr:helix-turn-helix transcriptional regulator [Isoptericola variabilis]AEG43931.1 helix-turn-helix domain protein [Isoptericola variabilis 225]TWH30523.1 DNA-binding XRE family transcriptional regulator [Isoptericola variabilis J7]
MTTIHDIGGLVRTVRWEAGLTQDVLAARAGVSRTTLTRIESGGRNPSLPMLERILAAAGKQVRIELDPLDADVRAAIAARRASDDPPATVEALLTLAALSDETPNLNTPPHRFEGVAAASLLGAPVPVDAVDVALADVPETWRWLTDRLCDLLFQVTPTGWRSWMPIGGVPHRRELARMPHDEAVARFARATELVRMQVLEECTDRRFTLTGPFDGPPARVRLVEPEELVRAVPVETELGTMRAQPLDEIQVADGHTQRVLQVLREELAGCAAPGADAR